MCDEISRYRVETITMTSHEHFVVSNRRSFDWLLNSLCRPTSKKQQSLCYTAVTGEFPAQRASNAEKAFIWWRHHDSRVRNKLSGQVSPSSNQTQYSVEALFTNLVHNYWKQQRFSTISHGLYSAAPKKNRSTKITKWQGCCRIQLSKTLYWSQCNGRDAICTLRNNVYMIPIATSEAAPPWQQGVYFASGHR